MDTREVSDLTSELTNAGGMYQIRTKRVGRVRLDTKQAGMKNEAVLFGR
ncbi:MAG: hypothetical protein ACK4RF_07175 [Cyclobacteriaceae bacterium]